MEKRFDMESRMDRWRVERGRGPEGGQVSAAEDSPHLAPLRTGSLPETLARGQAWIGGRWAIASCVA